MKSKRLRGSIFICLLAVLVAAAALVGCGGSGGTTTTSASSSPGGEAEEEPSIEPAPAFTADELGAEPGANWFTNGGSITNDRYSTLDEIDTENVSELKADWMTKIGTEAKTAKFSAEGQALAYEGTIYIPDGADNVYAIDASTGEILWTYEPHLPADPLGEVICCGWDNRGVAIGDGMVFVSQLNGDQVALDQQTGKVKWSTSVVKPRSGYSITSAPLYYDGRLYVGGTGGEYGVRGRLTALDAKTGKIDWRFYTIPGPGEVGHDTWPQQGDAWKHGGASIWNTPAVDPERNMIYFSTSNAAPWVGADRPGDNLFTASIVAIDAETGEYKWHYQQVHHDLWDFDSTSPVVLFDGEMNGEMRHGVGEPSKTGWLYLVDRETGKPIYPIPEVKVPQDPSQNTSPTQPEPTIPPFAPVYPTKQAMKKVREAAAGEKPVPTVHPRKMFAPMTSTPGNVSIIANYANGGANWPPSSFDPENDMYFVCAKASAGGQAFERKAPAYKQGEGFTGTASSQYSSFNDSVGLITAYDMSTGKIAWQDKNPESCYSGTVTTAGGLLFVGQNNGELQAFNLENGEKLWGFQTGASVNTTVTAFEDEGEEKIAVYAGGNSLAATAHGDNFWVFSLKGTVPPAKGLESGGEGRAHTGDDEKAEEKEEEGTKKGAAGAPDAEAGKEVFAENCSTCHGADGLGGNGGPDLTTMPKAKEQSGAEEQVTNGGGGMPAFKGTLTEEEIKNVAAYVVGEIVGKK